MSPIPVAARIAQCLAALRSHPEAPMAVGLSQSLTAWLSYYRILEPVRAGANPSTTASLQRYFSPLATALLDQVADTFCRFFALPWLHAERTHTRLTRAFPAVCLENNLQGNVAGLHATMGELHACLVAVDTARSAYGALGPVGGRTSRAVTLPEVLASIEQYLVALLDFFDQNRERSILHSPPHPEAS